MSNTENNYLQFENFGDPASELKFKKSTIGPPNADQVQIALQYAAINPSHILAVRGRYGHLPELPAIPGTEASAHIVAVGKNVSGFKTGDRVTFIPVAMGDAGTWQQLMNVDPDLLFLTPELLSDQQSGSIWINFLTAWVGLFDVMKLSAGQTLLLSAPDSQLSRLMASITKPLGIKTVGLSRRADSPLGDYQAMISCQGWSELNTKDRFKAVKQALAEQGIKKLTAVFDCVGGPDMSTVNRFLDDGGIHVVVGYLSGKPVELFADLIFSQSTLQGFWISKWLRQNDRSVVRKYLADMTEFINEHPLDFSVDRSFKLSEYLLALDDLKQNERQGKISFYCPA